MKQFIAALLLVGMLPAAWADGGPTQRQVYISPGIGFYEGPEDLSTGDGELGASAALGIGLTDRLAAEFQWGRYDLDFDFGALGAGSDDVDTYWVNLLYKLGEGDANWQPFAILGGGKAEFEFDDVISSEDDTQYNLGLGVFRHFTSHLALRADLRGVYSHDSGGIRPFAFVGLTGFIGGSGPTAPVDTDGDGVPDRKDKCPNTPPGRTVDETGCELDSDGDGVVDGLDQCPNTPAGTEVDERGCPPDQDTDGDGVPDKRDQCPDTPAGVAVDADGCPLDSDGDGVPDYLDKCPGSEAGAKVDEHGCYIELEEAVTIDLNIEFDTNSSEIRPSEYGEIDSVVTFLRQYPTANAVIEGHTDSDGAANYNQALSERRARAVYDYLISEAGIPSARLNWAGFGETRPVASNDTVEGKQRNRRVSAVVSGTKKVRQ